MIEEEELLQLPPLISYCSYVKYGCAFGKWLLLALIVNTVALVIVLTGPSDSAWPTPPLGYDVCSGQN